MAALAHADVSVSFAKLAMDNIYINTALAVIPNISVVVAGSSATTATVHGEPQIEVIIDYLSQQTKALFVKSC